MRSFLSRHKTWMTVMVSVLVLACVATVATSGPRRRARIRRTARPRRYRTVKRRTKVATRRRIPAARPVVYGGGGTVVVESGGNDGATGADAAPTGGATIPPIADVTPMDAEESLADSTAYEVVRVDHETMTVVLNVEGDETPVRMIGLAPIGFQAGDDTDPRVARAREQAKRIHGLFLQNLLSGETVYVVYDEQLEEEDDDGNVVAYLYRAPDGLLVNMEAIRQGFGAVDTRYEFDEKDSFVYYQAKAREHQKGIWKRLARGAAARAARPPRGKTE